ncbi:hypothetical protein [Leptolyngbya sp. 7M]|uniref:hypothetical protein n=1 Tax=Leptolyngbya sp. 7M TaxID=2812896 RepID=UPI001B8C9B31|nr:hypothetical protein [Leptolyngbya sp. 7M]QYO66810.1 hypothetical protein JVX88_08410 [Leptolyngbya sp. 7M]
MNKQALQKRPASGLKEKGQYLIAFGVVASMLVVANIPVFVVFFFGVFAFFLYKMFSTGQRSEAREIFEFYLTANEMLREDDRRWYGFEMREAIDRGESLIHRMSAVPPLVHFSLGALYNKVGDHKSAVKHLAHVIEDQSADERAFVYPTPELKNYVKILRKIERDPADAPLTSAAVRSLERARRIRGAILLEESRTAFANEVPNPAVLRPFEGVSDEDPEQAPVERFNGNVHEASFGQNARSVVRPHNSTSEGGRGRESESEDIFKDRKPISEVLHDIYDSKRV